MLATILCMHFFIPLPNLSDLVTIAPFATKDKELLPPTRKPADSSKSVHVKDMQGLIPDRLWKASATSGGALLLFVSALLALDHQLSCATKQEFQD